MSYGSDSTALVIGSILPSECLARSIASPCFQKPGISQMSPADCRYMHDLHESGAAIRPVSFAGRPLVWGAMTGRACIDNTYECGQVDSPWTEPGGLSQVGGPSAMRDDLLSGARDITTKPGRLEDW